MNPMKASNSTRNTSPRRLVSTKHVAAIASPLDRCKSEFARWKSSPRKTQLINERNGGSAINFCRHGRSAARHKVAYQIVYGNAFRNFRRIEELPGTGSFVVAITGDPQARHRWFRSNDESERRGAPRRRLTKEATFY